MNENRGQKRCIIIFGKYNNIGLERKNDTLISSILSRYPNVDIPYIKVSDEVIINVSLNYKLNRNLTKIAGIS